MKVILQQDVQGSGKKGDIVQVSDGYARNFLLPKGLAIEASINNINTIKSKKDSEEHKKNREVDNAKKLAEKLSGLTVHLQVKAGENGKLFGSITSKEIALALENEHHILIDKKKFHVPDPLKIIGTVPVSIRVYPEISANINVEITSL